MVSVLLYVVNGLYRNFGHRGKVFANNDFTQRRGNAYTIMGNVYGVQGFDANEAQILGREFGRFNYDCGLLAWGTTFNGGLFLGYKRFFGEGFGPRVATNSRGAIAFFTGFFGVIGTQTIFSFNGGSCVLGIIFPWRFLCVRRVLATKGGQTNGGVGVVFCARWGVLLILFTWVGLLWVLI